MYKNLVSLRILKGPILVHIFVLLSIIVIFTVSSLALYQRTIDLLTENLRERLLTISITVAANIDANNLAKLQEEKDWEKPEWTTVVNKLHNAKYSNKDIVFMYIFRKKANNPEEMQFVADADSINPYANNNLSDEAILVSSCPGCVDVNRDGKIEAGGPDKLQWPGQDYPEAVDIPEAFKAYEGPLTSKDLYTDAYGTVLTGYAPIKDVNGRVVAILGTDIKADDFFTITKQTLYPFLAFIFSLVIIIIIFNVLLIRSISKEVRQREEIAKMAQELERAYVVEKQAKEELQKLDEVKNQFLQQTQHDLRAPLGTIRNYCDLLLTGAFGKLPKKSLDVVKRIQVVAENKIKDVNNFLDTAQFQLGKKVVTLKPGVELNAILQEIITDEEGKANDKKIYLKLEKPEKIFVIEADREKLKGALFNIIDNAINYTATGGVTVRLANHDTVKITISDTGIGIPKERLSTMFDNAFERSSEAKKASPIGRGIGGYLSRKIIEAHNGKIWAESEGEGKGSTFHVELPIHN